MNWSIVVESDSNVDQIYFARLLREYVFTKFGYRPTINEEKQGTFNVGKAVTLPSKNHFEIAVSKNSVDFYAENSIGYEAMLRFVKENLFDGNGLALKADKYILDATEILTDTTAKYANGIRGDIRIIYNNIYGHPKTEACGGTWRVNNNKLREQMLLSLYETYNADIIGLQEFSWHTARGSFSEPLKNAGFIEVTPFDVKAETPLFYKQDRLELLKSGNRVFSVESEGASKSVTWAIFRHKLIDKVFLVLSTHLAWQSNDAGRAARKIHTKEIIEEINSIRVGEYSDIDVILGGDMNCWASDPAIQTIKDAGMRSTYQNAKEKTDSCGLHPYSVYDEELEIYTSWSVPNEKYEHSIDHSWYYGDITFNIYATLNDFYTNLASDHCPQLLDITFNK